MPAKNLQDLIAWLKANPSTPYATSGVGTTQHLCGEMLADAAGLKMSPVSYRASNQSIQDLIGGQIACDNFSVAIEHVRGGKLRAVAVTSPGRYALAPEIQPTGDTLPGLEQMPAFGWLRSRGFRSRRQAPYGRTDGRRQVAGDLRAAMEKFGVIQTELSGADYAAALAKERAMYARIIEKAGIKVPEPQRTPRARP